MPGPGPHHVGASVGHQVGAQARASPTHQRPWGEWVGMEWGGRPRPSPRAAPSPPPGQRLEGSEGPAGPAADYQSAEIPARAGALARPGPAALSRVPIARGNQPRTPHTGGLPAPVCDTHPKIARPKIADRLPFPSPADSPTAAPGEGMTVRMIFTVTSWTEGVVAAVSTMRDLQGLQNRPVGTGVWATPL